LTEEIGVMDEPRRHCSENSAAASSTVSEESPVAAWRAAKGAPDYREEAARQAASAAHADVEDRVMEWIEGVGAAHQTCRHARA
jgi:hypothetical protein